MLELYLIRHAESQVNANGDTIGGRQNHVNITARGKEQCDLLAKRFQRNDIFFDEAYSSPAIRAHETAKIVCTGIKYPIENIAIRYELQELSQGDWEKRKRSEIYTPETIKKIREDNHNFKAPGGESQKEVEERVYGFIQRELLHKSKFGTRIALFGHGTATKCLLRKIMGSSARMTSKIFIENTSITRLCYDYDGWMIGCVNDYAHLQENTN